MTSSPSLAAFPQPTDPSLDAIALHPVTAGPSAAPSATDSNMQVANDAASHGNPPVVAAPESTRSSLPARCSNPRYQSLDVWRGVACLSLLFYHATFFADRSWNTSEPASWTAGQIVVRLSSYLWVGVPLFFVVSGYCIGASVDSLRRKPHSLSNYFLRRFRRIYPPLWIACGLAVAFCWSVSQFEAARRGCPQIPDPQSFSAVQWLGNFSATESWLHHFTTADKPTYLMPNTWTLCYEEQFYAATGFLLLFAARRFFTAALAMTLATLVARHACRLANVDIDGFFFDGHWLLFAAGLLVFQAVNYATPGWRRVSIAALAIGAAYALADRMRVTTFDERHLDDYLVAACGFAIFLIVARRWDAAIAEWRVVRPLAACGRMSYSIYLTHYPIVVAFSFGMMQAGFHDDTSVALLVMPAALVVSLPIAWLFHRTVERRFLNAP